MYRTWTSVYYTNDNGEINKCISNMEDYYNNYNGIINGRCVINNSSFTSIQVISHNYFGNTTSVLFANDTMTKTINVLNISNISISTFHCYQGKMLVTITKKDQMDV